MEDDEETRRVVGGASSASDNPANDPVAVSLPQSIPTADNNIDMQIISDEPQNYADSEDDDARLVTSTLCPHESRGLYFRDGRRKIDFILVHEESKSSPRSTNATDSQNRRTAQERHERWRNKFLGNLRKIGLDMEEEVVETNLVTTHFIKLCAPWAVLMHFAEELNMRAPLQAYPSLGTTWTEGLLRALKFPNVMIQDVPCQPLHYFTCPFKKSKLEKFLGSDNHDTYFTNTQRSRMVQEILQTSVYGKRRQAEVGIDRMVAEGAYQAAFPLHEGTHKLAEHRRYPHAKWNRRQILYEYWAKWGRWYKYQPLDHIREYFGEKIAYYFAWLGFYTGWLIPAAIVGALVFLYGVITMGSDRVASAVCDSGTEFKMCPLCTEGEDGCNFWYLSDVCQLARFSYLFDHPGTVFYAVFIAFWSVSFLEYWKRSSISLAHYWDCMDMDLEEERPRPQFAARAAYMERNPVTGIREPSFPKEIRIRRMLAGTGVIILMMCLVIIFIMAVIIYRILVSVPLFQNPSTRQHAPIVANLTGSIAQLVVIVILGKVYERLAQIITEWEMHRTVTEYEDHLTFKVFVFQFTNYYSAIFYVAFFKGRFAGYPGHYNNILGLRPELCNSGGCLVELAQQLGVIMIGKQIINNTVEILIPKVKSYFHRRRYRKSHLEMKNRWEEDYELLPYEGLFDEYLEMIIQYGFITIFVAAFPLAPLFALLNNLMELRLDALKITCETRRVVAQRARDIGIWFTILEFLTHLSVISNAFLIAFTSDFLPRLLYRYHYNWEMEGYVNFTLAVSPNNTTTEKCRYIDFRDENGNLTNFHWTLLAIRLAFVLIFEHVIFGISRMIEILVPDIPENLDVKIRRERYLAKQALTDSDNIVKITQQMEDEEEEQQEGIPP